MKLMTSLLLILISSTALGAALQDLPRPIRSLGMGGAYVSFVKDSDAVFYNPAALSNIGGFNWQLFNIGLGTNQDTFESIKELKDMTSTSQPSDYQRFFGKNLGTHVEGMASFAIPHFGVGIYDTYLLNVQLNNPAYPQFDANLLNDVGVVVGASATLGPAMNLGIALKRINRWGGPQSIGVGTIVSGEASKIEDNFKNKGTAYGADAGLNLGGEGPLHPTLSVVWQDMGFTTFKQTDGLAAPPRIHDNLTVGAGTFVDLPGLDWTNSIEFRHLTESNEQIGKKVHLGTEISLPLIDLRAGINQGYTTYGAGFDFYFLKVDAAYYKEELGVYPGQTPDTRFEIGLSLDLSFDANFKFTDNDGKKRRLKQRR